MCITLAVHLPSSALKHLATGYRSSDSRQSQVSKFTANHDLPYADEFVSIAVYAETDHPRSLAGVYGEMTAILNNASVLPELAVVCTDDFQDCAYNGYQKELATLSVRRYVESFTDLSGMTNEQKIAALQHAEREKVSSKYAEARMFRPLRWPDLKVLLNASGEPVPLPKT